jgi:hypothetical protein
VVHWKLGSAVELLATGMVKGLTPVTPPKLGAGPVIGVTTRGVPCELGSLMGLFTVGKLGLVAAGVYTGPNDGVALVGWFTTGLRLVAAGVCTDPNDGVAAMAAISLIVPLSHLFPPNFVAPRF